MSKSSRGLRLAGTMFVCAVALAATAAGAAVYHVAVDGDDANDGLTPATAWATLARVNAQALEPGDSVLFRRGDVWRGQLVPRSGSTQGHVTYGAYGSGAKPLLLGSVNQSRPEHWTHQGDNIWVTQKPELSDVEHLPNPSFTEDTASWGLHTEGGAAAQVGRDTQEFDSAPASYRVHCVRSSDRSNHIQLSTSRIAVRQDTAYRLTFRAKSSQPFEVPAPRLMKAGPPWDSYVYFESGEAFAVDAEWATYTCDYEARITADDARLTFFLGGVVPDGVTLHIDSLSLRCFTGGPAIMVDVGNIVFDHGASCGIKVWSEDELDAQGKYWYDWQQQRVKLYSATNPAEHYGDIECALRKHIIDQSNRGYVIYEHLALLYGAAHGIGGANAHHIIVRDCDIGFIGGGDQHGRGERKVRYGNGVEFWANAHDNLVERCRLWEIYDAALTNQSSGPETKHYNIVYRHNLIWNCEYSFEYWNRPEASETYDVYFEHNTCLNAGHGWGNTQRPDPSGRHLCFYTSPAAARGIVIRNNIFFEARRNAFYAPTWTPEQIEALVMDHNCWYQAEGHMIAAGEKRYTAEQFADYQRELDKEPHSIVADPRLVDPAGGDFRLTPDSPCIDAGVDAGARADFEGTPIPQGAAPDIGAFEFERE